MADSGRPAAFAGDWHANRDWAVNAIRYCIDRGVKTIIHTGDFGWKFDSYYLDSLETELERCDIELLFVDGNHDDHDYLQGLTHPWVRPHVRYLRRGETFEVWADGHASRKVGLALGGAVSVDKLWRSRRDWWPQETLSTADLEHARDMIDEHGPIDFMVTHDAPSGVTVPGIVGNPHKFPERTIQEAEHHRTLVREIVDYAKPKRLFHGHYHVQYRATLCGDGYETQVLGLDADNSAFGHNIVTMNIEDL